MNYIDGTWVGEERETVSAGRVSPGSSVRFPRNDAESFEKQGLFKPDAPKRAKKQPEEVTHVRSAD